MLLPKVTFIVVNYNTKDITLQCINSFVNAITNYQYQIIVVDNGSYDDSVHFLRLNCPQAQIIEANSNLGYAKACNLAKKYSTGDILIFSNSDIIYNSSINNALIHIIDSPQVAISGVKQLYPDGKLQKNYGYFPSYKLALINILLIDFLQIWKFSKASSLQIVDYADGGVLIMKSTIFDELNGFDPEYFFFSEEMDIAFRAKKLGYLNVVNNSVNVIHYRSLSFENKNLNKYLENSKKKIELLYSSKLLFCNKNLNKTEKRVYLLSELIKVLGMSIIQAFLSLFSNNQKVKLKIQLYAIKFNLRLLINQK